MGALGNSKSSSGEPQKMRPHPNNLVVNKRIESNVGRPLPDATGQIEYALDARTSERLM